MEETNEQLMTGATVGRVQAPEPDETLVHPRFDVREEQTAQPVVPLAVAPARRRRGSSSLPVALILVSAVVGGLVSVVAYRTYQRRPAPTAAREEQQRQAPAAEAPVEASPTPEYVAAEAEVRQPAAAEPLPPEQAGTAVAETETPDPTVAARVERTVVKEDRKPEAAAAGRPPPRKNDGAKPERTGGEPPRARRVDVFTGPVGERVSRREPRRDDSEIEGEATDYEAAAERRARRRAARRAAGRRNVDRVRAIFEGDPPRLD